MKSNLPIPPKYAEKFLEWVLKKDLAEEVLGDLKEKFYGSLKNKSPFRAKANYWYQTLNYLRPFAIKNNLITDLNLWQMLSKDFVILVMISCLFAFFISYYLLNSWLQNYEYRIDISWRAFALASFGALLITLVTVSFQAIKAALANPINALKSE